MVKWAPSVSFGTSLMVQWLRLCAPNADGLGSIPGWGTRSHMQLKILHATSKTWCRTCESWTMNKVECRGIDAFKLWCWRRLLRVLWTAIRSNQSILKEINPEYSLEGLMLKLKLKLQYVGQLMRRANSLEKTLMGKRRSWQRTRWLDGISDSMGKRLSKL